MSSVQETLEYFSIYWLYIFKCTSVIELLFKFKRFKSIKIRWYYDSYDDLAEWKLEIEQFEKKMRKKHSEIDIDITYLMR